jgi:hypothetical protein
MSTVHLSHEEVLTNSILNISHKLLVAYASLVLVVVGQVIYRPYIPEGVGRGMPGIYLGMFTFYLSYIKLPINLILNIISHQLLVALCTWYF